MESIKYDIKKAGKGHDIFVNGKFVLWVIGSKKNARMGINKYLSKSK